MFSTKCLQRKMEETQGRIHVQVPEFFSASNNQLAFRYKMGQKIKEIREGLDEIAADMSKFNFTERYATSVRDIRGENRDREQTHSHVLTSSVIGREEEKEEIVKLLIMCSTSPENVSIIPIVGMGGLGKTSLAKLVYNDERVVNNFELRMWVWAYGEFDVRMLAEKVIKCGTDETLGNLELYQWQDLLQEKLEMEQLQILLRKKLKGKRYLLVLDDVWNENYERWVQLKDLLVQLWMAQGYIDPQGRDWHLEDIGAQYFNELYLGSFFEGITKDDYGYVVSCRMHDLIHDLARYVAGNECLIANVDAVNIRERVHHVSFNHYLSSSCEVLSPLLKANKIRTFILPLQYHTYHISAHNTFISVLRSVRVLDLHNLRIEKVPTAIEKLNHLRYLDLSGNSRLKTLPGSISKLQNLQTLKLQKCYKLKELPRDIRKMINLRHLEIQGCSELTHMPSGLAQLTSLQTLPKFILGKNFSDSRFVGGLNELNDLDYLRGELHIVHLEHAKKATSKSMHANLKGKKYLQALKLHWCIENDDSGDADAALMEGLQPHQNLKELNVSGYGGVSFPSWMMYDVGNLLPNLVMVTIESCVRCKHLPPFSQLPSLKVLKLYVMSALEYINVHTSSNLVSSARGCSFFPSLKELILYELPVLKEWPMGVVAGNDYGTSTSTATQSQQQQIGLLYFPCLTKLTIVDCPSLICMPLLPHCEELVMENFSEKLLQTLIMAAPTEIPTTSSSLARLKFLRISSCKELVSLPEDGLRNLTSLEILEISSCENLHFDQEGYNFLTRYNIPEA